MFRRKLASIAAALTLSASPTFAFGTVQILGQDAEHERITRAALKFLGPKTLDEVAGKGGTFGAVGAPDHPARGLMSVAEAHCDGADYRTSAMPETAPAYPQTKAQANAKLTACKTFIVKALEDAVAAAAPLSDPGRFNTSLTCVFDGTPGRAKCTTLEFIGMALHASQDFYSHSNWTDRAAPGAIGADNPPGLGYAGRAPWLDPRTVMDVPDGLITGCYDGFPESRYCEYAGMRRVKHETLNKDKGRIRGDFSGVGATKRGAVNDNFARAVAAAIDDTRDKWAYFEERVMAVYGPKKGTRIICVVRGDSYKRC
jgi:hypothetical protein